MAKYVKKDTPIQVNSNLIGVMVEPGESDINCVVFYSINGWCFISVDPVLTDSNNVIANIPRYMYLKFSQDVVITEE